MSNPCTAANCVGGNCPGCRNFVQDCSDPRCFPNCPGCVGPVSTNSNWVLVTIILVLLAILLVLFVIIAYSWYKDRQRAAEPKRVTVNKHMHTVVPASIVVTSPAPIPVVTSTPVVESSVVVPPLVPKANCPGAVRESISYNGSSFSLNPSY
jgi:hypothetical protein